MNDLLALIEAGGPIALSGTAGALYAREHAPRGYWSTVGLPAALFRIGRDWASTMEVCGLSTEPPLWKVFLTRREGQQLARPVPPKVRGVRPSTRGVRLRVRLAKGMTTATVADAAEALRHAWQVHSVHVVEVRPGIVDIRITGFDVLRNVVMPGKLNAKPGSPLRVPVALAEDGTVYERDYQAKPHALNLGATGSGKSMLTRNLIHGLAPRHVAICGVDCKMGVEQMPFAPRLSALAPDPDAALDLFRVLVKTVMVERYDLIRDYLGIPGSVTNGDITADIWGLPERIRPVPIVVIVDEIAELFLGSSDRDKKRIQETVTLMVRFAQLARSAGMYLEVNGQRFGSELGKGATLLRSQLSNRVVHRVNDTDTAKMGLGDVAESAVHAAVNISPDLAGVAIAGDTSGHWQRIRTPYRSLNETAVLCAQTAHLVPNVPALNGFRPVPVDAIPEDSVYIPAPAAP
ncbi:FtsK/SpoIIIE domain-containing protein [Streptacidiphilus anmyonensis]|uniref:FtsK/SpoIIIE domain-containing protein n=1 Tax=Streptacidiphilus anmyonensis TaxID=405782 RepID=UPI0005A7F92B|nr:FtsK/SpoIIIE domain-containing protein [Streptacidiphilus anmyonensis]